MTISVTLHETVQSSATTNLSFSHTITGTQHAGDLWVIQHVNGGGQTWTDPTGWSVIHNTANTPESTTGAGLYYKNAFGTIANPTVAWGTMQSYLSCLWQLSTNIEGAYVKFLQKQSASVTTDNQASYTTTSMTIAAGTFVLYGICSEGGASAITYSQAHGDTEITDQNNGGGTPEQLAAYSATGLSGATTRTMTPSTANQVAALTWIAEFQEVPMRSLQVPSLPNYAIERNHRW